MVRLEARSPMLTYSFVDLGSDSLYEHLYKCIKNDIMNGKLKSGDKLPSKRSFAKNLEYKYHYGGKCLCPVDG